VWAEVDMIARTSCSTLDDPPVTMVLLAALLYQKNKNTFLAWHMAGQAVLWAAAAMRSNSEGCSRHSVDEDGLLNVAANRRTINEALRAPRRRTEVEPQGRLVCEPCSGRATNSKRGPIRLLLNDPLRSDAIGLYALSWDTELRRRPPLYCRRNSERDRDG
jgi:hypothetical protein